MKEEVDDEDRSKRNEEVRRDDGDDEEGAADHRNDDVDKKNLWLRNSNHLIIAMQLKKDRSC